MSTRYQLRLNRLPNSQGPAPSASSASPAPSPQPLAPHSPRRGILLLVVLGLLTLFLFIGTAFVISSNQFRLANRSYQRAGSAENVATTQRNFLDEVLNQLVRDTNNQNSVLRYHSLLRDLYGTDGFTATIDSIQWAGGSAAKPPYGVTEGQMIEFQVANIQDLLGNPIQLSDLSPIDGKYNGLLVTFLCGANTVNLAEGTTRIVSSYRLDPANTNSPYVIRVLSTPLANGQPLTSLGSDLTGLINTRIVVNGRPFNGTGVGYDPNATAGTPRLDGFEQVNLDTGLASQPIALMPNAVFFIPDNVDDFNTNRITPEYFHPRANPSHPQYNANATKAFDGQGGSDESYDAADFQNMFLAWSPPSPELTVLPDITNPTNPTSLGAMVLPSFHRPELINHWLRNTTNGVDLNLAANASMLRKIMLRPNWWDHPNFDGSNPYLSGLTPGEQLRRMVYGPWDVDNDKDGVPDSVWVDFGAPVIAGPDGKLVKPLAAILVLDLDGRLNVNAHGTRDLAGLNGNTTPVNLADKTPGNPTLSSEAPKGQVYGPAEISLEPLLKTNQFQRIINGANISGRRWSGRYADNDGEPGKSDIYDLGAQLKMQGYPSRIAGTQEVTRSLFATLPDLRGRYAMGLNNFGQSITDFGGDNRALDEDNPYELNLSAIATRGPGTSVDNPFSLAELERVLRAFDIDSPTLPPRLHELLKGNQSFIPPNDLANYRALLTTDSYDLPEPGFQMPEWVRTGIPGQASSDYFSIMNRQPVNATFADLIEYRLRQAQGLPLVLSTAQQNTLRAQMSMLIAPEMMAGLKLDLNRPLGNGRDDNNNRVVDEPGELEVGGWLIDEARAGITASPPTTAFENAIYQDAFDRDGDGVITLLERGDTNGDMVVDNNDDLVSLHNYRRQLLARHLYVLATAVVDPLPQAATAETRQERARQLAQWAINAVDFRDPDNIMTAFEYDVDPLDGWQVDSEMNTTADWVGSDNIPNTNDDIGGIVWGTERPELVMTETLAWHDRATHDLTTEDAVNDEDGDGKYQNDFAMTTASSGSKFQDTDEDQRFRPQGAAFIELYNPWGPSPGANADTHAVDGFGNFSINNDGNDLGIDLARTHDLTPSGSPVWRIAAYRSLTEERTALSRTPRLTGASPLTDPDDVDSKLRPQPENPANVRDQELLKRILRTVYFTNTDPNYADDGEAFYASSNEPVPPVRPGRYLVVGSGEPTGNPGQYLAKFGELQSRASSNNRGILLDANPTAQHAVMVRDGVNQTTAVTDVAGFELKSPSEAEANNLDMVPNAIPSFNSTASVAIINQPRRFTLTEPAKGYPNRVHTSSWNGTQYSPVLDIPLDDQRGTFATDPSTSLPVVNFAKWSDAELQQDQLTDREDRLRLPVESGKDNVFRVIPGYSWLYLQRLANPLLPYNRISNPYLTVDSMGANVTVFNGRESGEIRWQIGGSVADSWWKPLPPGFPITDKAPQFAPKGTTQPPLDYNNGYAVSTFSSLQRGRENNPDPNPQVSVNDTDLQKLQGEIRSRPASSGYAANPHDPKVPSVAQNLWNPEQIGKRSRRPVGIWRNAGGNTGNGVGTGERHWFQGVPDCTLGFLNEPFRAKNPTDPVSDRLKPVQPFPWIAWNNRPFANPGELVQVPAYRSSQFLKYFSFLNPASATAPKQEVYDGTFYDGAVAATGTTKQNFFTEFPYRHLLNFFRTRMAQGADATANTADDEGIAGLYRVLDLVEVPSRYVGTETWLNPATFGNAPQVTSSTDPRYQWQPPFNRLPTRREPGKVNINTIANDAVWHGLFHGSAKRDGSDPGHPVVVADVAASFRRGYGQLSDAPTTLDSNSPTLFANPFRASDTGDMVPTVGMLRDGLDSTFLRSTELPASLTASLNPSGDPLFTAEVNSTTNASGHKYRDSDRNPYFRYAPVSRLSSMTTTRSNVFAVWITVGFFEVEEAPPWTGSAAQIAQFGTQAVYQRVYPDGYMFSKEAGSDTGDIVRVREFAIVDRTIPVGFQPGANHNVKETIRLKREIE